jgi:hypothetical protein
MPIPFERRIARYEQWFHRRHQAVNCRETFLTVMAFLFGVVITLGLTEAAIAESSLDTVSGLRCEWRVQPADVPDPCPDFYWEAPSQGAYRLRVAGNAADLAGDAGLVWDSGRVESSLPIAEYAGPELAGGTSYFWTVRVWDAGGRAFPEPPVQYFRLNVRPLPHHLPTIRTFINLRATPTSPRTGSICAFGGKPSRAGPISSRYATP